jgi:D-lactate dehydrogenase (cytochrome)
VSISVTPTLLDELKGIVGDEHVITDQEEREYFSRDLSFEPYEVAAVVVQPASTEEVAAVVALAHRSSMPVVARGGGMSYTQGYTPARENTVLLDMRRMDAVVEIVDKDLYAVIECGTPWEQVYRTLDAAGLRTPYFGPLSGRYATVGGALSQNSLFYGSGQFGTVADSVLGLEVVLGDGRVLHTGSWARRGSTPFMRYNGPDLTGLFLGDTGAFGIKTRAAIKVVPKPELSVSASFAVPDFASSVKAMRRMQRIGTAAEVYGLDPFYHETLAKAGLTFLAEHEWSVHVTVDAADQATADAAMNVLRQIGEEFGTEIENTAAVAFRADPFGAVQSVLLGPEGQLWLPIHAFLPYSKAPEALDAVQGYLDENRELMERHGIRTSLLTASSGHDFVFEPSFYWKDELGRFRLERILPEAAEDWGKIEPDTDARAVVLELRRGLRDLFDRIGGVHIQIGKYYEFGGMLEPTTEEVVRGIKELLDPDGLVNPGSLGFGIEAR